MLGSHYLVNTLYCIDGQSESGKRKGCYRILGKDTFGSVQIGLKLKGISKGKRDMQKDQGLPQLLAREISQGCKETLARAARMAEILRSQPHKGPGHRAEEMNRMDMKWGYSF